MPYAVEADVRQVMGKYSPALNAQSVPATADVPGIIDDIQATIDAVLSAQGLAVPVDPATAPPEFLTYLKNVTAYGAAARIVAALFPAPVGVASTTYHLFLNDQFQAELRRLQTGASVPDLIVDVAGGGSLPRSLWTSFPVDDDGNDRTVPIFTRNTQW